MKKDIHPKYDKAKVECACGYNFETRSTVSNLKLDICSQCHPFFTGKQKLVDTAGRVDKFKARVKAAQKAKERQKKQEVGNKKQENIKEIKEGLKKKTVEVRESSKKEK